jgi:hypothetical protein
MQMLNLCFFFEHPILHQDYHQANTDTLPQELTTDLLDHQRDVIKWIAHQETKQKKIPFV